MTYPSPVRDSATAHPTSYTSGGQYVGEFKDSMFHGQGITTTANGGKYVGGYIDGRKNGQGTLTYANGDQEEGIWEEGEFLYEKKASK